MSLLFRVGFGILLTVSALSLEVRSANAQEKEKKPAAAPAPAATSEEPAAGDAKAVYAEAARAYEERRYRDAIDLFREANRLTPNPAFDFNVGLAYEDLGDPGRGLEFYRSYLRREPKAADRTEVETRILRLEKVLEKKGLQQVTVLSDPPGARFEIDGVAIAVTPWTGEVAPGFHRLTLDRRGYKLEERTFDLPSGRSIDVPVTLTVEPKVAPVVVAEAPPPAPKPPPCEGACLSAISPSSWTIAAVGAASLVGGLVFEIDRAGKADAAEREPNQVAASVLFDDALASQKWATGFAMMGGALLLSGGVLAYLDIRDAKADSELSALQLACFSDGCALGWQGHY